MVRIVAALSLVMLTATASAGRTVEIVEYSIEATLSQLTMPSGPTGNVIFDRGCEGCEARVLLASAETRYFVRHTQVPYEEFRQQVDLARNASGSDRTLVGVYYDPDTERVTRLKLFRSND